MRLCVAGASGVVDHPIAAQVENSEFMAGRIGAPNDAVRIHVLAQDEEAPYFDAARRFSAHHDLGRLMLNQGCRPEEILALRTDDVDLERALLTIRDGKSHAARRQLKLMAESLRICAQRATPGSRWLFPGKLPGTHMAKVNGPHGKVLDDLAVCKCTHRRRAHVKGKCACGCAAFNETSRIAFVIYDFRHTFATRAAESGMPVATLAKILGHADLRSVMKYVHVRQEAQDRAMLDFENSSTKPSVEAEPAAEKSIRKPAAPEVPGGQEKERVN